jgi:hypothetical protein
MVQNPNRFPALFGFLAKKNGFLAKKKIALDRSNLEKASSKIMVGKVTWISLQVELMWLRVVCV